jgi:hypothetical protein
MPFNPGMFFSGAGHLLGGLFGDSGKPYGDYQNEYQKWVNKAQGAQQPYQDAGTGAIGKYQDWLNKQQDPSGFINDLMGQYSESPYAKYQQQQSLKAGQNAASASGLTGSTPLFQQLQQNSQDISSKDQNQWLQHVLGINTEYGQGQENLINGGQNSANQLTNLYGQAGNNMGEAAYNKGAGKQNDFWTSIGGGLGMLGGLFGGL